MVWWLLLPFLPLVLAEVNLILSTGSRINVSHLFKQQSNVDDISVEFAKYGTNLSWDHFDFYRALLDEIVNMPREFFLKSSQDTLLLVFNRVGIVALLRKVDGEKERIIQQRFQDLSLDSIQEFGGLRLEELDKSSFLVLKRWLWNRKSLESQIWAVSESFLSTLSYEYKIDKETELLKAHLQKMVKSDKDGFIIENIDFLVHLMLQEQLDIIDILLNPTDSITTSTKSFLLATLAERIRLLSKLSAVEELNQTLTEFFQRITEKFSDWNLIQSYFEAIRQVVEDSVHPGLISKSNWKFIEIIAAPKYLLAAHFLGSHPLGKEFKISLGPSHLDSLRNSFSTNDLTRNSYPAFSKLLRSSKEAQQGLQAALGWDPFLLLDVNTFLMTQFIISAEELLGIFRKSVSSVTHPFIRACAIKAFFKEQNPEVLLKMVTDCADDPKSCDNVSFIIHNCLPSHFIAFVRYVTEEQWVELEKHAQDPIVDRIREAEILKGLYLLIEKEELSDLDQKLKSIVP